MNTATDSPMKTARLAKGWSQRKLADVVAAAGVPVTDGNLSRIERGEVSPTPKLRRALCDVLGLATGDLP